MEWGHSPHFSLQNYSRRTPDILLSEEGKVMKPYLEGLKNLSHHLNHKDIIATMKRIWV